MELQILLAMERLDTVDWPNCETLSTEDGSVYESQLMQEFGVSKN